ncbi:uncharacterized protein BJX67DRAFT_383970 [Aspergillus lucknowensis]|uniref:Uncharacterized protein n=1 Tax=Aspergillus lucknowensis TaxID=176173 RepID=A0ABR4LID3_9EURO
MVASHPEPIAVVGSGCRFPGSSSSPSRLWDLLEKPRDVSTEIPDERFELKGYYHPTGSHHGTTNVQRAYMLNEDFRVFDAAFFNISPNEADSIDPQQRLLMEVVYDALEAGGHPMESLRGTDTAVFVGTMSVDYNDIVMRDVETTPTYFATGTSRAILSNRISYFFDWHGPSMTIDTACSSSMVALHQCVQSLRSGESRVAIAGGTELLLGPEQFVGESKMNLLSPTGRSRMWDADANGYARGDGIAALVLKKLSDAIADGDHIECVIRETGVNQDGKSTGLTVPSSEAQAALITRTYARAGLDISDLRDRPQYFEAHGTGTKVGDPREAAAIKESFHGPALNGDPLYVGSIKTIIGHTEGTAGLAGVLKASLAIQRGVIPPNMLLNRLNPDVQQYYDHLRVPTTATPWPTLPEGVPRRASVNSFGFGGTNGHAIIESYEPSTKAITAGVVASPAIPFTPFTFSAATDETLVAVLQSYSDFLRANDTVNLCDLAWTLQSRKSALAVRTAISALTVEALLSKIEKKLEQFKNSGNTIGFRSTPVKPRVLGVFTGQGAQWASMGAHLIRSSAAVRAKIDELDDSLATLPKPDRPSWKIADQLCAAKNVSRLGEAALSQPLCTAMQIVLVDLLRSAGITFQAVVGHSSGEIAAAYAAGFISAQDAVRIAYYRGVHAKHARGPKGQKGAMLAVGTSLEDAQDLLDLPVFKGRVKIAAHNSSASVTLSGDADGIAHAKRVFDEEKKFARILLVDTAYHSHHMIPCSDPYVDSLRVCGVQIMAHRDTSCTWYSSVKPGEPMEAVPELCDVYWRDNMVSAVLFAEAVKGAATAERELSLAVEVGPHPALKGPASQNLSEADVTLPYTGVLSRGNNDVEALSDALGFLWTHLGPGAVNFLGYQNHVASGCPAPQLVVGLPSYQWNHKRVHWHESRKAKKMRLRGAAFHALLGVPSPNNTEQNLSWTNFLKSNEIHWLDGHQLQGQTVFPAAGYVAMALEACMKVAGGRSVKLLEVQDLTIGKAITFDDGANFAVETLVTLTSITPAGPDVKVQTADFAVHSCPNTGAMNLDLVSSGKVKIVYGVASFSTLSSSPLNQAAMAAIDSDRFYKSLLELGYGYNGPFRTLNSTKRKLNQASAVLSTYGYKDDEVPLVVHPTMLDVAFQASFLAQSAPGDDQLWSLHVPTSIKCIRVNPELCTSLPISATQLPLSAVLHEPEPDSISVRSSIDVFNEDGRETLLQVEGLVLKPFSPATAADDRPMFSTTRYGIASPDGASAVENGRKPSQEETKIATICERVAYYYMRKLYSEITDEEWEAADQHYWSFRDVIRQLLLTVEMDRHPVVKKDWTADGDDLIKSLVNRYSEVIDVQLVATIGQQIPTVVRSQSRVQDSLLDWVYSSGLGFAQCNAWLAHIMQQITHRYPHVNVLEIGARGGHATRTVLQAVGEAFGSFTFTDASEERVRKAPDLLKAYSRKTAFKILDPEQGPASQGFEEGSYDVVVASDPMKSVVPRHELLQNARRLLKPGGHLLLATINTESSLRLQTIMGVLPEYWTGTDSWKSSSSGAAQWHSALRKAGFSGIDTMTPQVIGPTWPFCVIAAQAVDDRITFLRTPLSAASPIHLEELVILGNGTLKTCRMSEEIAQLIGPHCSKITTLEGLPTDDDEITPMSTFINLVDLDDPIFKDLTEARMEGLKCLFELASNVLWVTQGARADEPYHNASIGFGRTISFEMSHLSLQFLDLDYADYSSASRHIAESVLRLAAMDEWEAKGTLDGLLWSKELELYVENGQITIPRIVPVDDQNARINSLRRPVTKIVDPQRRTVCISQAAEKVLALREEPVPETVGADEVSVRITHSMVSAINIGPECFLFPSIGKHQGSGERLILLSQNNASKAVTSMSIPLPTGVPTDQEAKFLTATAIELLARALFSRIPASGHLLVHEPGQDGLFSSVITREASRRDICVTFSTTTRLSAMDPSWIELDPWTSAHVVEKLLPAGLTHFLDLSTDDKGIDPSLTVREFLPAECREINVADLFRHQSQVLAADHTAIFTTFRDAVTRVEKLVLPKQPISTTVLAGEIADSGVTISPLSVVDWTVESSLAVHVQPINGKQLFSRNKAYLLVGLSGELGRSVCEWMARNGAGYVCLTSRRPQSDEEWEAAMKRLGTIVRFFAMDITKKQDLQNVVDEIKRTCPPIAGVANGAAVFHDAAFSEMSFEMMEKVLKPKIDGTRYLDEVFGDTKLDFFIVFSSLTAAIGNSGQCNYTAGNAYMTGLVCQRRKRGLAGTSLDIGRVAGIGYVERAGDVVREQLIRFGFVAISETDLHQLFAEAVLAGYPDSDANPIVTTGCRMASENDEVRVPWFSDARLSHKVVLEARGEDSKANGKRSSRPVREQLAEVTTKDEALEVIKDCFAAKLAMISRLAEGQTVDHNTPLVELGIDSLVAVEVRGWFLKELKTDMPVLKVLGGGSVAVLCQETLDKLPESLLANLGAEKKTVKPKIPELKAATRKVEPAPAAIQQVDPSPSGSSQGSSAVASSGSQTPTDTPATPLSKVPSDVDLAMKAAQIPKPQNAETKYVKSEVISFPQSRFWFLRLLIEDQTTFNVAFYCKVTGNLRIGDLERAVRLVSNRHEALRTCFVADDNEADVAYQKILPSSSVRLERKRIKQVEEVAVEYAAMKSVPFDLESGKLMRMILLTVSPTEHYLLFNYHHILMDGVSFQNFLVDLEKAYNRQPLGTSPSQLPEVSRRQRATLENGGMDSAIAYWRSEFPNGEHSVLPLLPMAQVSSRAPMKSFQVHQVQCDIEPQLMARIREKSKAHHSTTFHFYLAVFKAMLLRFADTEDLTIGIADANRHDEDVVGTVGLMLNLLPLRFKRDLSQQFGDAIAEARSKTYEALANSRVPFDVLLKELNIPRSSSYSPFFQAFFDYRQGAHWKQPFGSVEFEFLELSPGRTAYDMTLDITDTTDSARILFRTQAGLYDVTAAQLLLNTYVHLLEVFSSDTSVQLQVAPLFSQQDLDRALKVGQGPDLKSSWIGGTLTHRIDQIAAEKTNNVALKDGHGNVLTYAAMTDRIQAIAESLQQVGVVQGSRVLVFEDATADWPCSMLAIMRLGAVYIPLDLRNPLSRLADVATSCQPVAILVDDTTVCNAPQVNLFGAKLVNLSNVGSKPSAPVVNHAHPDSVAAILYTSGSTGKPKGIVVKHSGLRNEIEGYTTQWDLKDERVLQQSAFTFNHSSDQMYTGLVNGGSVYIVPWNKRGDPFEITKIIQEEGITYTKATPAEYMLWLDYGHDNLNQASNWRFAFGGGESLTPTLMQSLATLDLPALRFFNSYGPTEISISSTKMEVAYSNPFPEGQRIPCGYSLPNYVAYILDEDRRPVPIGMPGELWIGGAGVSLGYLDNEELTDQHFMHNPYATPEYVSQGWTRMYRTGDIAHLREDGAMVFHHRVAGDTQVKIRGLRIELGDIESNIIKASNGALKEAIVTLRDGDPPLLVAHVVFALQHGIADTAAFLQNLLKNLQVPQYMVPVVAIPLERMPLSNHSKVDRNALKAHPLPQLENTKPNGDGDPTENLSETMTQLRRVWEEVLNCKEFGFTINSSTSFFTIGGNSLLAVRLQSRIRQVFNVTVRLVEILGHSTLAEMGRKIEESASIGLINWDEETALPEMTVPRPIDNTLPIKATNKVVLITGAGGFLGKHIVEDLVASPGICKIHCIGLREKTAGTPRQLAVSSPKIVTYAGDLSEPWLGLGEDKFAELANEVDSILHMAAVRSFWDNYHLLRPSNVNPTKQLSRMAAVRRIPIKYVSTAGVLPPNESEGGGSRAVRSVSRFLPASDGSNGYAASRWASEVVLERAASSLGVPVSIHRFVPSENPSPKSIVTAALEHIAGFVDKMSIMPDCNGIQGHFEMTPVETAAAKLATSLIDGQSNEGEAEPRFSHHECEVRIEVSEMKVFLEERYGDKRLGTMPALKFFGRMKSLGLRYFVTSQVLRMESGSDGGVVLESRR